jgi:secreted Zn-dependent insulinase-like peptidase
LVGLAVEKEWMDGNGRHRRSGIDTSATADAKRLQELAKELAEQVARTRSTNRKVGSNDTVAAAAAALGAADLKKTMNQLMPTKAMTTHMQMQQLARVPMGSYTIRARALNANDPNSCGLVSYQIGLGSDARLSAQLSLVAMLVKQPAFAQLRSKEQLGYIVFSWIHSAAQVLALNILVQSPRFPAAHLTKRIGVFVQNYEQTICRVLNSKCSLISFTCVP